MFGGNISSQRPGDPANLFTYQGPRGIKVRSQDAARRRPFPPSHLPPLACVRLSEAPSLKSPNPHPHPPPPTHPSPPPPAPQVRGLLTGNDVDAALQEPRWLASAHVLIGTPPEVLHAATCERPYLDLTDLKVVVADEVDEVRGQGCVGRGFVWGLGG
jgi:hypothetical protein